MKSIEIEIQLKLKSRALEKARLNYYLIYKLPGGTFDNSKCIRYLFMKVGSSLTRNLIWFAVHIKINRYSQLKNMSIALEKKVFLKYKITKE